LKAARADSHEVTIRAANIENQLYTEWDSLSLAPDAARNRHNETAMGYKEWYREMRVCTSGEFSSWSWKFNNR